MKNNIKIVWDYPSMPIDLSEIIDLEKKEICLKKSGVTMWRYVKMTPKTIIRIYRMLAVIDAFKEYLERKKSFDIIKSDKNDN